MGDRASLQASSRSPNKEIFPKWHSTWHFLSNTWFKFLCCPYFSDIHVCLSGEHEVLSLSGVEYICIFSDQRPNYRPKQLFIYCYCTKFAYFGPLRPSSGFCVKIFNQKPRRVAYL
jgi:hypothetical protein